MPITSLDSVEYLPVAREKDIVTQQINDDILVYDTAKNKAHHLNKTTSLIWQKCDGKTTFDELIALLTKELGTKIDADFIWLALSELKKANLLKNGDGNQTFTNISRRKVLFKYSLPLLLSPIVVSLVAPQPALAQSCVPGLGMVNDTCTSPTDCCPGLQCVGIALPPMTCQPTPMVP